MKLARDTWLTFQYETSQLIHNPVNIAVSLLQPVTYLLLFTPFIKSVMGVSTYSGAYQIYVPSLFVAMGGFQAIIIAVVAAIFGLRMPLLDLLAALALLSLMVLIGVSISNMMAILVPDVNVLLNVTNGITEPIAMLAGILIPISVAPLWVRDVDLWNPFAWGSNGMHAVFQGHIGQSVVWEAAVILAVLAALTVAGSSRLFTRQVA